MHSPHSPGSSASPGLTETSATLDQYFDLDSLIDQSPEADKQLLFADSLDTFAPLTGINPQSEDRDTSDLLRMIMEGQADKSSFDTSFVVPSMNGLTGEAPAVDPHFITTPSGRPAVVTPEDQMMEEDDDEDEEGDEYDGPDYVESEEDVKPKVRSSSRRKAPAKSTRQSVADLALPMDLNKPVASSSAIHGKLPHMIHAVPDYIDKPAPEIYKKMSSKEKRQYRNKVSARNFRHRRKEYITQLEGEIAQRDSTITLLSDEVDQLKTENETLKTEMISLRDEFRQAMAKFNGVSISSESVSTPAMPLKAVQPSESGPVRRGRSAVVPKLNKDVIPSSKWGAGGFSGISRDLGVHHTILPERHPDLSGKPRHLNPLLRNLDPLGADFTGHLPPPSTKFDVNDEFMETNPYALSSHESMRRHLYAKITHNQMGPPKDESSSASFSNWRPAFFTSPSTSLSGKPSSSRVTLEEEEQAAYVAGHASSTLFSRMASAFAEAFAGPSATTQVADVLAGRAQVRVVPTIQPPTKTATEEVAERLAELRVTNSDRDCLTSSLFGREESSSS